jgi:hypothetical protein
LIVTDFHLHIYSNCITVKVADYTRFKGARMGTGTHERTLQVKIPSTLHLSGLAWVIALVEEYDVCSEVIGGTRFLVIQIASK